jgi:uncharacterized surface protein with fasciclin (FAS1) repeats
MLQGSCGPWTVKLMNEKINLVERAKADGRFRVFLQAVDVSGLTHSLQKFGPYTILAPVDDAFGKMRKSELEALFKITNRDTLKSILKRHIIADEGLTSAGLKSSDQFKSMAGDEIRIESRIGLWVNEGHVIVPDLKASNGILHGIDTVLMAQTGALE